MDTKITLKFNEEIIAKAKAYAESHGMSLSRLTEYLYLRISENQYPNLEELPISDWVNEVSEGDIVYITKPKSNHKKEYFESRK